MSLKDNPQYKILTLFQGLSARGYGILFELFTGNEFLIKNYIYEVQQFKDGIENTDTRIGH